MSVAPLVEEEHESSGEEFSDSSSVDSPSSGSPDAVVDTAEPDVDLRGAEDDDGLDLPQSWPISFFSSLALALLWLWLQLGLGFDLHVVVVVAAEEAAGGGGAVLLLLGGGEEEAAGGLDTGGGPVGGAGRSLAMLVLGEGF